MEGIQDKDIYRKTAEQKIWDFFLELKVPGAYDKTQKLLKKLKPDLKPKAKCYGAK